METFSALLTFCTGNSPVTGEFPSQRPVTRNFDVFFDPCQNKRLSKQSWGWWFETQSRSLWRHCNVDHIPCRYCTCMWFDTYHRWCILLSYLYHGRRFADDNLKCIFLYGNLLKFHWYMFPKIQLTISQHWFKVSNRWRTINWTNDGLVGWPIYTIMLGLYSLLLFMCVNTMNLGQLSERSWGPLA